MKLPSKPILTTKTTRVLSYIVVIVCAFRFLFDGVHTVFYGHTFSLGHMDAMSYGAILTPVLGAHGYIKANIHKALCARSTFKDRRRSVDNPDL